ncbi:unnamed protein product, partial [marine sediment metagenome]
KALIDGGLEIMEITMRTEQGISAVKNVKEAYPDMLIGAGTVLSIDKAKEAVDAGAEFIVSPGLNPELVEWCLDKEVAITPWNESIEAILIILPPVFCFTNCLATACEKKNNVFVLILITSSQSFSVKSIASSLLMIPALFIRISTIPQINAYAHV